MSKKNAAIKHKKNKKKRKSSINTLILKGNAKNTLQTDEYLEENNPISVSNISYTSI